MNLNPKVVPFERGADFMRQRAMKNLRDNNIIDALELMRRAVETSPENNDYRLEMAQLYCDSGCPRESGRMLLDMIVDNVYRDECLYGLAINQLNMGNPESARRHLGMCISETKNDDLKAQAERLLGEMEMFDALNRPESRKTGRVYELTDTACAKMRTENYDAAIRAFDRALKLDPAQMEVRALKGMAFMMQGRKDAAVSMADEVAASDTGNIRALCVSAQIYGMAGEADKADAMLDRAAAAEPDPAERRMMVFTLFEAGRLDQAAAAAKAALEETPCDRVILHALAVIALNAEGPEAAMRYWKRILRINPDDTIASYYYEAAEKGELDPAAVNGEYQVPRQEALRRYMAIAHKFEGIDFCETESLWRNDEEFRSLMRWSLEGTDERFRDTALSIMASVHDTQAESIIREYVTRPEVGREALMRVLAVYNVLNLDVRRIVPTFVDTENEVTPDGDAVLSEMTIGHKQLVRLASEVLEMRYGIHAYDRLSVMWDVYRRSRTTRLDPLLRTETAAAALAYCYLAHYETAPRLEKLAHQYRCSARQLRFFAAHMSAILERGGMTFGAFD